MTPIGEERPRERCLKHGARALSTRECLALILSPGPPGLGSLGIAHRLMEGLSGQSLSEEMAEAAFFQALDSHPDWRGLSSRVPGLGPATQARLLALHELARRYSLHSAPKPLKKSRARIDLSQEAFEKIPRELLTEPREWLGFVPLLQSPGPFCLVERGARTHVNVEPAELFARILALRPRAIWLFHNHPSGDTTPSDPDLDLTDRVEDLCSRLGIGFLGHAVVSVSGPNWIPFLRRSSGRKLRA